MVSPDLQDAVFQYKINFYHTSKKEEITTLRLQTDLVEGQTLWRACGII